MVAVVKLLGGILDDILKARLYNKNSSMKKKIKGASWHTDRPLIITIIAFILMISGYSSYRKNH